MQGQRSNVIRASLPHDLTAPVGDTYARANRGPHPPPPTSHASRPTKKKLSSIQTTHKSEIWSTTTLHWPFTYPCMQHASTTTLQVEPTVQRLPCGARVAATRLAHASSCFLPYPSPQIQHRRGPCMPPDGFRRARRDVVRWTDGRMSLRLRVCWGHAKPSSQQMSFLSFWTACAVLCTR